MLGLLDFLSGCPSLPSSIPPFLPPTPERPPATAKSKSKRPRTTRPSDRERQATANRPRQKSIFKLLPEKKSIFKLLPRSPHIWQIAISGTCPLGPSTFIESSIFIMVFSILKIFHIKRRLSEKYCEIIKKHQGFSSKVKKLMHMTIFSFS